MNQFYTYYEKPIFVIDLPSYKTFQSRLPHNKKNLKGKKTNIFYYFFQLYLNSLVYFYPNSSVADLFNIANIILKDNINFIEHNILIKMFNVALLNNKSDNPKYYKSTKNFIWDNKALKEKFNNDKELIKNYKFTIIAQFNKKKSLKEKEEKIKEEVLNYVKEGKYKSQIIKYLLNKKYDKDYIYKIINTFELKERNNTYILIDELLNKLFKQDLKEKLTNENIIFYLNNTKIWDEISEEFINISIKKSTYYKYLKENLNIKNKIIDINKNIVIVKEEVKENIKVDNNYFEIDDDIEEVKKIITWDEMEELEKRTIDEWNDDDELFFKNKKKNYEFI